MEYYFNMFYQRRMDDETWWYPSEEGKLLFSFDRKKVYDFDEDYPSKLTFEEKEIFDRENPYLASKKQGSN